MQQKWGFEYPTIRAINRRFHTMQQEICSLCLKLESFGTCSYHCSVNIRKMEQHALRNFRTMYHSSQRYTLQQRTDGPYAALSWKPQILQSYRKIETYKARKLNNYISKTYYTLIKTTFDHGTLFLVKYRTAL